MTIILIILAGFLIRIISLNQSLWLDEGTTALISKMDLSTVFNSFLPGDFHPPLYYLFIKYWVNLFGDSEIALRFPSVIFGTATIYTSYLIAKHFYGSKAGKFAAVLVTTSGLAIYYSQEARMYSMTAFLVSLCIYYFIKEKWLGFSMALALTGLTDYVALYLLPMFIYFGIRKKNFLYSTIPLLVAFIAWQPVFIRQIVVGLFIKDKAPLWWDVLGSLSVKNLVLFPVKFVLGRISFENDVLYFAISIISVFAFVFIALKAVNKGKFLLWWLLSPVLIAILLSFKVPTLNYFRFLFCLPALYILVAGGVTTLSKAKSRIAFTVVLLINVLSSGYYLLNPTFHREDWRSLVGYVESQKTESSITLFVAPSNMEAYQYYAPNAKIAGPEALAGMYDKIWLMTYLADVFDPGREVKRSVESQGYGFVKEYSFRGMSVLEYSGNKK